MTPDDFIQWRKSRGLTGAAASRILGIAPNTVTAYEKGRAEIPRHIALACAAVAFDLPPWRSTPECPPAPPPDQEPD